ncbi:UDP-glucose--hexose-1-phosphate uridylyltransferase [Flavihumibacter petaseus]|uniref:Galactose-1-phosphate uridylyltransferase n=1 Tax=Flavihumibacter petaseus NBRC 106054 TaxID=1220578 RepID=A0A0E9MUY5_9BACT|nr:UDP-glucose--hexose-1-phosphate uridylyltransferase [Flavihumibacter petaseus]GAO41562.1 galactose-1-phosphate uridylyltransferase [Flavihumibacter petaseus NBRC 106054]
MTTDFSFREHPHTRFNILTGDWILVSPHRTKRPWQGKVETLPPDNRPAYDPACYLCPGNRRADGAVNPQFDGPFAFTNDFAALLADTPDGSLNDDGLLIAASEKGTCRVIGFSPRHDLTLPQLTVEEIKAVIRLWQEEFRMLSADPAIHYIQIFENKGEIMGCSNPHPHGQIWASSHIPLEIDKENRRQEAHFREKGRSLLSDYLDKEMALQERIVTTNEHFVALVPFWATWPYETMIISRRHVTDVLGFTADEVTALADILKKLTTRYDNLFNISFPYSAGMHQAPVNSGDQPHWHWHMHFYPPLLRSATVKKFMVGYEMLANPQRDVTPEWAAERLRGLSELHYKENTNQLS